MPTPEGRTPRFAGWSDRAGPRAILRLSMQPGDLVLSRFEVERCAGTGGMGIVYRAKDLATGVPVALKVLHAGDESVAHGRFLREARVLSELTHPAVVRYVAHGVTPDGHAFLAMEWLEGQDLAAQLAGGEGLSLAESVSLASRVSEALAAAHARGVVHRDVKPSNVFLPGGDIARAKLLDFGVARLTQATRAPTASGLMLGTPGYMAPEQARGSSSVDARADVFSLGCVLFECVAGRPAFVGQHVMAVLAKILFEDAPRLSELRADTPEPLVNLVARMLAKDPSRRPASGGAVLQELSTLEGLDAERRVRPVRRPPALTRGEQRMTSVIVAMAASRVRSSPLAETVAADDTISAIRPLRPPADAFGAQVEHLLDGSVVASLSEQGAATDQAARAARCALSIRASLPDARVVLATGRAIVSGRLPIGEVIDEAVRMLGETSEGEGSPLQEGPVQVAEAHAKRRSQGALAPMGPVIVDDVTAGLLDTRFDVRGGKAGLELHGERESKPGARTLLGRPTPFVGRERELSVLTGVFEECAGEPVARAVLVTAPAGVGKSRLLFEFLRTVEGRAGVLVGRGDPMRVGSPLGMIAPALRALAGLSDGDNAATRRKRLAARVGRHLREGDCARVTEFMGEIAQVPFSDEGSVQLAAARRDAMLMSDQMRRAWEDFLEAECRERPVVLVFDDLHWGDMASVQFVDSALRRLEDRPLMVLALARPEVHDIFPKLWAEREAQESVWGCCGAARESDSSATCLATGETRR